MKRFVYNKPRLRRHREYWYKREKLHPYGRRRGHKRSRAVRILMRSAFPNIGSGMRVDALLRGK